MDLKGRLELVNIVEHLNNNSSRGFVSRLNSPQGVIVHRVGLPVSGETIVRIDIAGKKAEKDYIYGNLISREIPPFFSTEKGLSPEDYILYCTYPDLLPQDLGELNKLYDPGKIGRAVVIHDYNAISLIRPKNGAKHLLRTRGIQDILEFLPNYSTNSRVVIFANDELVKPFVKRFRNEGIYPIKMQKPKLF
jgi:hypothetical protein